MNSRAIEDVLREYNSGNFEGVTSKESLVYEVCPNSALAWTVIGASYLKLGAVRKAVDSFGMAVDLDPCNPAMYSNLGAAYRQMGDDNQAIILFSKSIEISPAYSDGHYNLACIYRDKGLYEQAISSFESAILHNSNHKLSYTNLGAMLLSGGSAHSAIECFKKSIEIDVNYAEGHYNLGLALHKADLYKEAINSFERAIALRTDYAEAYDNLGVSLRSEGELARAIAAHRTALAIRPDYADACNNLGAALQQNGEFEEALKYHQQALGIRPDNPEALISLGIVLQNLQRSDEAIAAFQRAIEIKPDYADAHTHLGFALESQGKQDEAISSLRQALEIQPDAVDRFNNLAIALTRRGDTGEAADLLRRATEIAPDFVDAYNNLGNVLQIEGSFDEAISRYLQAIEIAPDYFDAHTNLGAALQSLGRHEEGIASLKRAVEIRPDSADACYQLGNALTHLGRLNEAVDALGSALEITPESSGVLNNLGIALMKRGDAGKALECWQQAVKLKPDFFEAYNNLGNALQSQGRLEDAISAYRQAVEIEPDFMAAEVQLLHQQQKMCDWQANDQFAAICARWAEQKGRTSPFAMLSMVDDPKLQSRFSRNFATETYRQQPSPLPARSKVQQRRLRVGYFSADFRDHPVLILLAGLLQAHDRSQFEIFAFSYVRSENDARRKEAEGAVDHFLDVTDLSDSEIVDLARRHELDIAIDLTGYTTHSRSEIFQYRLAPIQISYLGYPSTMGADFIDYIVTDPTVIPRDQRRFYTERAIYLPHTFQPNDDQREIADTPTTRTDFGLPENGFVFCCFNNSYKIGPREFDIWMRLLAKVDDSVMWLLESNAWAEVNLRREASARGIDPERLVFARRVPLLSDHLARHRHADLFMDTFNYNAHTTASDALWAGLPVVTKAGKQFAARVAASLLKAIGLPELITQTEADYEALILNLATNPAKLAKIKTKLAANRLTRPLFDTRRFTRNFEAGLRQAYEIYEAGKAPKDIWVKEDIIPYKQ